MQEVKEQQTTVRTQAGVKRTVGESAVVEGGVR